jgi:hypothetical protein
MAHRVRGNVSFRLQASRFETDSHALAVLHLRTSMLLDAVRAKQMA